MASQPDLSIDLTTSDDCSTISLVDSTGEYDATTNPLGYGLPSGPDTTDVDELVITVTYNRQGFDLVYTFTVASGTITAATLELAGGDAEDILASLSSTSFPFTSDNPFDLFGDYGVDLPEFVDEVYTVAYQITGNTPDAFDFTTTVYKPVTCNTECCKKQTWLAIDPACNCKEEKIKEAMLIETYLKQVEYAAADGDVTRATEALTEAEKYCDENCSGCGCG